MTTFREDLFSEHKEDLDTEWHETFDTLTAQGKSPSGIKATIEYATSRKTQSEVASEFSVSAITIRNLQAAVVALGPIDHVRHGRHATGHRTRMDYCNLIADALDWTEGVEYSVRGAGQDNDSPQPSLLKEGWLDLYQTLLNTDMEGADR